VTHVPLLDLSAQNGPLREDVLAAIARVVDSGQFILGKEVEAFEGELAAATGCKHSVGVSSGTDALLVALMALGVGHGDEVVTSTYSFFATAGCVSRLGAKPVLIDIEDDSFNIDPAAARAACGPKTKAVIPVHLFGRPAAKLDVPAPIVEDAAQSIGAAPTYGQAACLSFFPSKNLGAFGDAGAVITDDAAFADRVKLLRAHGGRPKYYHHAIGGNFRIDALQSAVLRVKLRHLARWTEGRRANAARYRELFAASKVAGAVRLPAPAPGHIYNQFVIRVPRRDELRAHLTKAGIGTEIYYPVPFHLQPCFRDLGYRDGQFPVAEAAARDSLALPIYPELAPAQQEYVVSQIAAFYAA
jgi:dTDP-4-amino-4,6-dideoxygalactose transaminase